MRKCLLVCLFVASLVSAAVAGEQPPQFAVWGKQAGEQAPLPAGWKEVPPDSDDLKPPAGLAADKAFVVFARNPMEPIYPGSFPREDELGGELRAFVSLGEYEPLTFGLRALRELKDVTVGISELTGPEKAILAANQFDIRLVRSHRAIANNERKEFYWLPASMETFTSLDIPADRTQQFWITVYVAPETRPGTYQGSVTIKSGGAELAQLPIKLKVLPLRLKSPPQTYMMWYWEPTADEVLYQKITRDLWEHGMNASWPAGTGEVGRRDPANKTRLLPPEQVAPMRAGAEKRADLWLKTEFAKHPRMSIGTPNLHWVLYNWDNAKGWDDVWPANDKLDANLLNLVEIVEAVRKQKNLPEVMYYLWDEAGAHPDTFSGALHYYQVFKAKFPSLKTFTTIGGGLSLGIPEVEQLATVVDIFSTNRLSEKIIRDIREKKRELHIYNGGTCLAEPPAKDRQFFGFYAWKSTATGIGQWAHYLGPVSKTAFRDAGENGYVSPSPDGPVPTVHWEALREGVDDMRYVVTLYDLILRASKDGSAEAKKEAESAAATLAQIESRLLIPLDGSPNHCLSAKTLSPRVYDKWRWRVAGHILKLHAAMNLGTGTGGEAQFPAREYKYSSTGGAQTGQVELLPGGDFENGAGAWAVQPWSGKGNGGLDTAVFHSGKNSMKMDNTGMKDMEVVVCVNYSPALKAGQRYRFSAWLKTADVKLKVSLRACGVDSDGLSGTSDWKQLSCDFTFNGKYLAVWLQGSGMVWVDDLSIRELAPQPALEMSLDATDYFKGETAAAATMTLAAPKLEGLALAVALRSADGKEVQRQAEPVRKASFRCLLPLAKLTPGNYEVAAELKDADGKALGQAQDSFVLREAP